VLPWRAESVLSPAPCSTITGTEMLEKHTKHGSAGRDASWLSGWVAHHRLPSAVPGGVDAKYSAQEE